MADLDYTKIDNPYGPSMNRTPLPVLSSNPSDYDPNAGENVVKTGQTLENLTISTWIKSRNYQPNKQGFMLDGQRGNFYGNNVFLTGTINAKLGKIGSDTNYWNIGPNGITAVAGNGDVIINYGKTDFGQDAINGFILGYDYSAAVPKMEMGSSASKVFKYDGNDVILVGGTITSGIIRTAASGARVEMNGVNNRMDIWNSAGTNIGWFGGAGANGNFIYINQPNVGDNFPPVYITSANLSNVINLFNTNASAGAWPAVRYESNNTAAETFFSNNTGAYIAGAFQSNSTDIFKPTVYSNNTAGGYCWHGVGNMFLNGDYKFYLRYTNTAFSVNTNGQPVWNSSLGAYDMITSNSSLSVADAAIGAVRVLINNAYYDLLYRAAP